MFMEFSFQVKTDADIGFNKDLTTHISDTYFKLGLILLRGAYLSGNHCGMNLYLLLVSMLSASSHADPDPDTHLHVHLHPEEGGGSGNCCVERHP